MPQREFRSIYFPYCIQKQSDGSWVVLNREYNPVGFNTIGSIDRKDYPVSVRFKGLRSTTLDKLSYSGASNGDVVYLYNDGCIPTGSAEHMEAYMKKLQIMAKLTVVTED